MASDLANAFLRGVSAAIDSQLPHDYSASPPGYNTAGGTAGQSQQTAAVSVAGSPILLVGALLVVGVIIFLAARR
jgi:hypothetical protein